MGLENFDKFKEAWFRGVYERHFPELYFYLRTFTTDDEMIRDAIQDAFVKILEKDKIESVSNIRNYLALAEEAVDNLPASCKAIFRMAKTEGLTYKQIAERMSLSVKTIETQMGIAFRKIREYVAVAVTERQ